MNDNTVAVIGVGTVGQSWAALFLSYGNRVRLWDPAEGLAERFAEYLETVVTEEPLPSQPELGTLWTVCSTVEEALEGATFVQENAPENMDVKHAMLRQIDEALPTDVIVGSSTSSFLLLDMVADCTRAPERFVLSHPFNPPHLMPLVELFGTSEDSVASAIAFYRCEYPTFIIHFIVHFPLYAFMTIHMCEWTPRSVGRHPITMKRQLPGHVANRLTSAIFREAVLISNIRSISPFLLCISDDKRMLMDRCGCLKKGSQRWRTLTRR